MQIDQQNGFLSAEVKTRQASIVSKAYGWMFTALAITGLTSYICGTSAAFMQLLFSSSSIMWILIISQLAIAFILIARLDKMSFTTARILFLAYAFTLGISLSSIFLVYTMSSIASTFFICSAMFGAMALYGHFTKKDLTSWGRILTMALIGLIIATLVNLFLQSSRIDWICSLVGVVLFTGLTAYDAQKMRQLAYLDENETTSKLAVMAAFSLYLDFVNLFLYLLRFFGRSDD
ncbi:MAG: Bax inhibitor-1/YccA family protein [Bacteroidetes bacterium]|uniref:Bax inhibitor-1/YccA family protein n=1 Tax=Candidatus Enterocola intestinipullorum TaxID=2840783 RepID=A0A9D9EH98_9BACT|nr:Bax inhibitor-1/YccA family protein [Candidatus Enterocola intestinipullorum]